MARRLRSARQLGQDRFALLLRHSGAAADRLERLRAAGAKAALRIHAAYLDARRLHRRHALLTLEEGSRPSTPKIQRPISMSFARSTPVCAPSPFSRYTTSSVARLPEAPGA